VQSRRDREISQCPIKHVPIRLPTQQTALQDALGQFLDKQRHTVRARDNLADDLAGQRLAAGDLFDQDGAVMPVEAIERQHADLFLAGPDRLELGAERHDQQDRQAVNTFDYQVEQLPRGRVRPMRVLEDRNDRLPARQALNLPDQRLQGQLLLPLRTEAGQRVLFRRR
jgi:hypothetical protein